MDDVTKRWIRNASDERAAANGCRFNEAKGKHACNFIEKFLRLYEGAKFANKPFILQAWQRDLVMRAFGWQVWSAHWGRWIRRFRKVSVYVPKKNGKSPLAAAVGLYLLIGDGEKGQKVFSAAKDGKQARIMHMHAMQMVKLSPVLDKACKVNQTTGQISYAATNSTYSIISGDNHKGQEGLNGSIVIDETHVVDDRLAAVLEFAGASRMQPMQFEVSTSGNNPDGYGKKQYDYGKQVERGEKPDDNFLFVCYEADQQATDDELINDRSLWAKANPSLGVTVNEEEFSQALTRAQKSLSNWLDFKMYRFNIWNQSSNPWLRIDDWVRCGGPLRIEDFASRPAFFGMDLSKTRDMSSVVFVVPGDEEYWIFPYFWLPEEFARDNAQNISFLDWHKAGFLELTPGNVIDYRYITKRVTDVGRILNLQGVAYDKTYAEEITQGFVEDLGIQRWEFAQSWMNFAPACADFERLILSGKLHHPNHPILNWQAGHIQVKTDANQNKRPIKPPHNEIKKIDGMVAAIMGVAAAITKGDSTSPYNDRGMMTL